MRPGPGRPADVEGEDEAIPDAADEEAEVEADDAAAGATDTAAGPAENATDKILRSAYCVLSSPGQHRNACPSRARIGLPCLRRTLRCYCALFVKRKWLAGKGSRCDETVRYASRMIRTGTSSQLIQNPLPGLKN